jgi:hypothetical protein
VDTLLGPEETGTTASRFRVGGCRSVSSGRFGYSCLVDVGCLSGRAGLASIPHQGFVSGGLVVASGLVSVRVLRTA